MPDFLWSAGGDAPSTGDAACEALLTGTLPPQDAVAGLRPLAEAIAALTAPPMRSEVAAEPGARELYRAGFARPGGTAPWPRQPARRRRRRVFVSLAPVRLAAVCLVLVGLLAAAAYSGVLPAPIQRFAHDSFGAPAPDPAVHQMRPPIPAGRPGSPPPGQPGSPPPGQPGKTPPGQQGHPPGQPENTPPGQTGHTPAGQAAHTPPGQLGKTPPGHGGSAPPGQVGRTPPGHNP